MENSAYLMSLNLFFHYKIYKIVPLKLTLKLRHELGMFLSYKLFQINFESFFSLRSCFRVSCKRSLSLLSRIRSNDKQRQIQRSLDYLLRERERERERCILFLDIFVKYTYDI